MGIFTLGLPSLRLLEAEMIHGWLGVMIHECAKWIYLSFLTCVSRSLLRPKHLEQERGESIGSVFGGGSPLISRALDKV